MVERTSGASALILAVTLAGCQPYGAPPPQGPYGAPEAQPYPAPEAYPPQPYPPAPGAYPGQPYQPGQPAPPDCPITASREWSAWINAMPGPNARPTLVVSGKVVTATSGYQVAFDQRMQIRRGQPPQAFVTLFVAPPSAPTSQVATTHPLRWEWPLPQPVGSVVISCGDKTLAEITNIQTAF